MTPSDSRSSSPGDRPTVVDDVREAREGASQFPVYAPNDSMPYAAWCADRDINQRIGAALRAGFNMEDAKMLATTPGSFIPGWEHSAGKLPEDITSSGESSKVENQ